MPPIPAAGLEDICTALKKGTCVPFLGAGISAKNGRPGLPLGGHIASWMVEKLKELEIEEAKDISDPKNLPLVSKHFEFHRTRTKLREFLTEKLPYREIPPLPAHEELAKLPLKLIITTNYDDLMERAIARLTPPKEHKVIVQPRSGYNDLTTQQFLSGYRDLVIYKMHGSLAEIKDDLVVTEDDFFEFLVSMRDGERGIPTAITGQFATATFLFLGFGLEDVDFKLLMKVLDKYPAAGRPLSYAIQKESTAFSKKYWRARNIQIMDGDVQEIMPYVAAEFFKRYAGK